MKKLGIVFGASGGIGSEIMKRLSAEDWTLIGAARNQDRLEKIRDDNVRDQASCQIHSLDITQSTAVKAFFESSVPEGFDHLGVAVAVGSIILKPVHLLSDEDFDQTLRLNLHSAFYVLRELVRSKKYSSCSVVLFSSVAARVGLRNHEAIAAAKAGVIGLAQSAAATYAKQGLRVNVIAPGLVRTELSSRLTQNEASLKASEAMHPLGRIGEPADVASLATWLMQAENSWISGETFGVDGGMARLKV
jgi:NAD(P)-dependent dehydrogenase (short-subunit alcohol dehydrogenase family)